MHNSTDKYKFAEVFDVQFKILRNVPEFNVTRSLENFVWPHIAYIYITDLQKIIKLYDCYSEWKLRL